MDKEETRREALAKLGLAVTAVYSAPLVLHVERSKVLAATPCPPPGKSPGKKPTPWCKRRPR